MTDRLFQRASEFVVTDGRTPFLLGNGSALIADTHADAKGRRAIKLWRMTADGQPDSPITTVSYWRPTHSRLTKALHINDIMQVASRYYLR